MRLMTRTNLAMRALMYCAVNDGGLVRKADIARACNASENHLALVIHTLGLAGFLETVRGRKGGMRLARPASEIRVGAVFRAIEGEVPLVECLGGEGGACPLRPGCRLSAALEAAVEAFYAALDRVTLADLACNNSALDAILRLRPARPEPGRSGSPCAGAAVPA